MPVITDASKQVRKSLILNEIASTNGAKNHYDIAKKFKWSPDVTRELMNEVQEEIEPLNTVNRLVLAIKTSPKAIDRLDMALAEPYEEPENKIRAGELGLRTLKALDPKLRTQELRIQHGGNVLLTIQNTFKSLGEAIESQYEVLPGQETKPEPEPSRLVYVGNQPTNTSARPENVQPEASGEVDLALDKDKS